ncbi:ibr finger domain containing protein [Grosmannia clavigera kw1407]|uniref:Ibr finger domain containing protein n=1 Tax=Grosmannia clavigera (strain kw1407 / UAMH 11150) TaxID=655863 RepID=F0XN32_GROCL|nr:ibr finger domain containing protein [Grosmannia clavigera kw1407]EFX00932.1 ibr finger domain containing protein [Grosmannia clavigera kw1407]
MEALSGEDASVSLMIELQLQGLQNLISSSKGKQREGEQLDSELALAAYKAELEGFGAFFTDRRMCMSIAQAVVADGELISRQQQEEEQAARDHQMALNLNLNRQTPSHSSAGNSNADVELLSKLGALYVFDPDDSVADQPESSSWASSRRPHAPGAKSMATCVSCREEFRLYDIARCPCSHEYCRSCLATLFTASMKDESLYPPRCCRQAIPLEPNRPFLPTSLVGQFLAKKVELDDTKRTYCHMQTCSTYIPAQFIKNGIGSCPRCHTRTCVICKGASHQGDCPDDPSVQKVLQLAAKKGWQRCYSCRRLVELELGCFHMSECLPIMAI